jgi:hypothetical protein
MNSTGHTPTSHVGELVSLAPLGQLTTGRVLSQSWSPALGEVLRLREEGRGESTPVIVLYGELLERVFPNPEAALTV